MSLDLAPDPVARALEPAAPAPVPTQTLGGNALTPAVAALPAQQRAGLDQMTQMVSGHLDAIRGGAAPPPNFAGALAAHDQVLAGLGLPIPDTHADVRATLAVAPAVTVAAAAGQTQDPARVAQALRNVREALSEQGVDLDVSHSDLERVERAFRALSPEDATAVARSMSSTELAHWTSEIDGTVGAYSTPERGRLFGVLAERLDATQLARFADALGTPASGGMRGQEFGRAIAAGAPEAVRAAFVRTAAPMASRDDEVGPAVGEALASLRGATLDRTLGALQSAGTLAAVVGGSVRSDIVPNYGGGAPTVTFEADTLGRVLRATALSSDTRAQATVVDAASRQLSTVEEGAGMLTPTLRGDSVDQIRSGITAVLRHDAAGIVGTLERANRGGGAFPDYVASMISAGQSAEVGRMLVRVGTGNGTAGSAQWVTRQSRGDADGQPYYANAQTLGFAVGSVGAAIESISDGRRAQGDLIKDVFGTAAGVAGTANAPAGAVASVLTGAVNAGVD